MKFVFYFTLLVACIAMVAGQRSVIYRPYRPCRPRITERVTVIIRRVKN